MSEGVQPAREPFPLDTPHVRFVAFEGVDAGAFVLRRVMPLRLGHDAHRPHTSRSPAISTSPQSEQ
jgi:hypothetical protein